MRQGSIGHLVVQNGDKSDVCSQSSHSVEVEQSSPVVVAPVGCDS